MTWSERARRYFDAHAIDPRFASAAGVRERNGALVYPYVPREGTAFERKRPLKGKITYQPKDVLLALWWPQGVPEQARLVLVCEGESDALAALSACSSRNGDERAREVLRAVNHVAAIPGTGYPVQRLVDELRAAGTREAYFAFDADKAGHRYAAEAAEALPTVGITPLRVPLPEGSDLSECLAAAEDCAAWLADALLTAEAVAEQERAETGASHESWDGETLGAERDSGDRLTTNEARDTAEKGASHHLTPLGTRDGETGPKFFTRRFSLEDFRPVTFAWERRIVRGALNVWGGEEGVGKGSLQARMIADATQGELPGHFAGRPARVLWIGDEDSSLSVVGPRLFIAGVDFDHVEEVAAENDELLDVSGGAATLEALIRSGPFDVVVFEQLLDNLPTLKNPYDTQAVRAMLRPLRAVLRRTEASGLATMHTNKAQVSEFRQKLGQSHQYNALSRSSMLVAYHPTDEGRRVLIGGKANYSALAVPISFEIQGRDFELNGHAFSQPLACEFEEEPVLTMEDVLGSPDKRQRQKEERTERVRDALTATPQSTAEVGERAKLPKSTVHRYLVALVEDGLAVQTDDGWTVSPSHDPGERDRETTSP